MLRLKIEGNYSKRIDSSKLLFQSKILLIRYTEKFNLHRVLHCFRYETYPDRSTILFPFLRVHISDSGSYVIPVQVSSVDEKNRRYKN